MTVASVPISEQLAVINRIIGREDTEGFYTIAALRAVLVTLQQHERAMAALREIADLENTQQLTDTEIVARALRIASTILEE